VATEIEQKQGDSSMKCSQCGETITGDDKFCGNCGAPVPKAPEPVQDLVEEVEPMAEEKNEFPEPVEFETEDVSDEDASFEDVADPFAPPDFGGESDDVPPPPPPPPAVEKKKPSTGLIIGIVVAVLLLCCCCAVIGVWLGWEPIQDLLYELGLV
jgi:hypothetical protein